MIGSKVLAFLTALVIPASGTNPGCQTKACHHRVAHKQAKAKMRAVVAPHRARLMAIATCETGQERYPGGPRLPRWTLVNAPYSGGLQFIATSWAAAGGKGLAADATRLEQLYRAVLLSRIQGWGAWPRCGR